LSSRAPCILRSPGWNTPAYLDAEWALSDNNRRAKFYTLTAAGRKRLKAETERWNLASLALNKALRAQEV
jgi:DNA-binding PadR family transcriptional regulator